MTDQPDTTPKEDTWGWLRLSVNPTYAWIFGVSVGIGASSAIVMALNLWLGLSLLTVAGLIQWLNERAATRRRNVRETWKWAFDHD